MEIKFFSILFIFTFLIFPALPVKAANSLDVIINEIAWMGTETAHQDEWIELYNNTGSQIDLTGWRLVAVDGTPEINLSGTVPAQGFYLLERTDDTTVPGIDADQIYTGALWNGGEDLELYNNSDPRNLIDAVDSSSEWFAGDNITKQTMERINPASPGSDLGNWQTSQNPGGTPKNQNSIVEPEPDEPEPEPEPVCQPIEEICDGIDNDCDDLIDEDLGTITCGMGVCEVSVESCIDGIAQTCTPGTPMDEICDQTDNDCDGQIDEGGICLPSEVPQGGTEEGEPAPEPEPINYPSGVFINEFLPSPEGPDSEMEWIELYNSNSAPVNLSGWTIEDTRGSTKAYILPQGISIQGYGFLVLNRPTSKIVLNNDGEGLILKSPLGDLVNSVSYTEKAHQGQAFAKKIDGTWEWTSVLTPGEENSFPAPAESEPESKSEPEVLPGPESEPEEAQKTSQEPQPYEVESRKVGEESLSEEKTRSAPYPSGILINEILPSPTGPDAQEEWVEVFNKNNFTVDLSGWQIQDIKGRIKIYTFPQGTKISSKGYFVLSRSTTKIALNNDEDGIRLTRPNGKIIDEVSYNKAPTGKSYNRAGSGWFWSDTLTPGSENIIPPQTSEVDEEEGTAAGEEIQGKGLAAISQPFLKSSRELFVLLIAFVIAIFSGIVIFILKKRLKVE